MRVRLEAALDFWCRMQHTDGRFSEYGPQRWNLPATAFATKFMWETLALLHRGPPIDAKLYERVVKANRKAIRIVMTDPTLQEHGRNYTNQYTNVFAGAPAFLKLHPDAEIRSMLRRRMKEKNRIDNLRLNAELLEGHRTLDIGVWTLDFLFTCPTQTKS